MYLQNLRLMLLTIFAMQIVACSDSSEKLGGEDVTQLFLEEYNGSYTDADDSGEKITIWRDGEIELLKYRDVGEKNNPLIPENTYCSYTIKGAIATVVQLEEGKRTRINDAGENYMAPETHHLIFLAEEVILNDDIKKGSTTDRGCLAYQRKMNEKPLVFTYGMELFGPETIRFHTQDEGDFKGGDRTESTLDEVFFRD